MRSQQSVIGVPSVDHGCAILPSECTCQRPQGHAFHGLLFFLLQFFFFLSAESLSCCECYGLLGRELTSSDLWGTLLGEDEMTLSGS